MLRLRLAPDPRKEEELDLPQLSLKTGLAGDEHLPLLGRCIRTIGRHVSAVQQLQAFYKLFI